MSPVQSTDLNIDELVSDPARLADWQTRCDRLLHAEGAGHLVHGLPARADGRPASIESRPWRLDPVPMVLDSVTFGWLAAAVAERMRSVEAVISDLYGDGDLIRSGVVDAAALSATPAFRLGAVGTRPPRWLSTYVADVVLGGDGVWYLVHELTDAPSGLGYALLDRSVISRVMSDVFAGASIAPLSRAAESLRGALAAVADLESPRIVVFTSGLDHPTYVDHSYLAMQLGVHLVEGADLVVREGMVWLRTLTDLEPVDVLYRRIDDLRVDPLEVGSLGGDGVPGLLQAVRAGGVVLANAHGAGIGGARSLASMIDAAIESIAPMEHVLPRWPGASAAPLSTLPTLIDGAVSERSVVLRLFAIDDGSQVTVVPGGVGRVLAAGDDVATPTTALVKDVWVQGPTDQASHPRRLPQVDLRTSLPTRAASALYWASRAAERAEAIARLMRVVRSRLEFDPGLIEIDDGAFGRSLAVLVARVARCDVPELPHGADLERVASGLYRPLADALVFQIGSLLGEALTVREYMSVTTGRVLAALADLRADMMNGQVGVDELDAVLTQFAAFAGMWHESTVRGPAWQIGDAGRRLERCSALLGSLGSLLGESSDGRIGVLDPTLGRDGTSALVEILLAANESLVAYRRRYRSEVEIAPTVELLVYDAANPRSLAAALDRVARAAAGSVWERGDELVLRAQAALNLDFDAMIVELQSVITDADGSIVSRWFSAPVAPIALRRTVGT